MEKTYRQLLEEIETLKQQAEAVKKKEIKGIIAQVRETIESYGLTAADVGFEPSEDAKQGVRPPRYRDGEGNVWSGRGPRPKWLRIAIAKGRDKSEFAVRS